MRSCEFCDAPVDDAINQCTGCGASQSTQPSAAARAAAIAARKAAANAPVRWLWLLWCFVPWIGGIGIVLIGLGAKKRAWLIEGLVYLMPFLLLVTGLDELIGNYSGTFALIFWPLVITRGLMLKPRYEAIKRGIAV